MTIVRMRGQPVNTEQGSGQTTKQGSRRSGAEHSKSEVRSGERSVAELTSTGPPGQLE